jgi:hypothetical protein
MQVNATARPVLSSGHLSASVAASQTQPTAPVE